LQEHTPAARAVTRGELATALNARGGGTPVVDGHPLAAWIRWDTELLWSVARYVTYMRSAAQPRPGMLDIATFCVVRGVPVDVWRPAHEGYFSLLASLVPPAGRSDAPTLHLLQLEGRRYAALSDFRPRAARRVRRSPGVG
jgi:hypothetical protein